MRDFRKQSVDPSSLASDLATLKKNSKTLNQLTDELTKQVGQIETVINALNLGLSDWVIVDQSSDDNWTHYVRLSYEKNAEGKWGLAINEFDEDDHDPDHQRNYRGWAFKEAPRKLRLKAVGYIPILLNDLVKLSDEMTKETEATLAQAKEIASNLYKVTVDGPEK